MELYEPAAREAPLVKALLEIWERSVRATHLFLSEREIQAIAACVPRALEEAPVLVVAEGERGEAAAFMGIDGARLEMLFLDPAARGRGLGRRLVQYGVERYGVHQVCVNEQNPGARGFYEHLGFRAYRRTEEDEQGRPYPLLYMRLAEERETTSALALRQCFPNRGESDIITKE